MTALVASRAAAPTAFERALLALSTRLSELATVRMQRRAASAARYDLRLAAADAQRDLTVELRSGVLPR